MDKVTENRVVTVKPGLRQEWLVAIEGRAADLAFSTRQLAVDFARAYAKRRRAGRMQVFNAKGVLEDEEKVDLSSQAERESLTERRWPRSQSRRRRAARTQAG